MSVSRIINILDRAVVIRRMHRQANVCQSSRAPLLAFPLLLACFPGPEMGQSMSTTRQILRPMRTAPTTSSTLCLLDTCRLGCTIRFTVYAAHSGLTRTEGRSTPSHCTFRALLSLGLGQEGLWTVLELGPRWCSYARVLDTPGPGHSSMLPV